MSHAVENGYLLVEIGGEGPEDRGVTMTFKHRICDAMGMNCADSATGDGFNYTAPLRAP